jgi:hypothetical protein
MSESLRRNERGRRLKGVAFAIILLASVVGNATVIYVVDDAAARVRFALLLMLPILWAAGKLGVVELVTESLRLKRRPRHFVQLRTHVNRLLDEIRRLNWMAADAQRGFRNSAAAMREMDAIEEHLTEMVRDIRSAAGRMSPDAENGLPARIEGEREGTERA